MRSNRFSRQWLVNHSEKEKESVPNASKDVHRNDDKVARLECHGVKGNCNDRSNKPENCDISFEVIPVEAKKQDDKKRQMPASGRSFRLSEISSFNQILEVLLVVVLVNFLVCSPTHLPLALAAFGSRQPGGDFRSHYAEPSSVGGRELSFLGLEEEDSYFRQAHSIGGSAFGYNGLQLQHNLDDNLLRSQNFKISPKPCSVGRIEGTCMFVWECIKSEGRHVGMCVDSFMFGSCCAHNYTDNIVLPNTFSYTRPTKPLGMGSMNHRPRPPPHPHRPSITGMTTIERPHGAGTLVIRPSGPHHQGPLFKPQHSKPSYGSNSVSTSTTTNDPTTLWTSNSVLGDMESSASISAATTVNHQQHWHLTTEPNFITKPRPPAAWDKPVTLRPKPPKPSKKPITTLDWMTHQHQQTSHLSPSFSPYPTRKPTKSPATATSFYTSTAKTTTSTSATTVLSKPTSSQTKPQVVGQTNKPTTQSPPSSTRPYIKPTSSINTSTTSTTSKTTTSTTTTLATTSSAATSVVPPTSKPSIPATSYNKNPTTTSSTTGVLPTKTTQRPTTSSAKPSTSIIPSTTTTTTTPSSSSLESNEIGDNLDGSSATIKTISAARSECGVPVLTRPETRIVGGKSAAFGRWPWQVSVRRTSFFGFSSTHRCGGALINENWIATAGHCVDDLLISQIRIRVGEYDFSHVQEQLPYIERGVAKKVVHPQYNFFTYEYDLALVKLEQPLEFAPHVSPICLPQTNSLLIGMNATVTGWGRLSEGGTLPSVLQEVSVPIVSNDNCKSMFLRAGRQEFIPEIFLCAGYETGGQDSCQGDSGGPLQVKSQDGRYFLAGIISWGIGCAEANLPGVCTRISKFVPWIMENVT